MACDIICQNTEVEQRNKLREQMRVIGNLLTSFSLCYFFMLFEIKIESVRGKRENLCREIEIIFSLQSSLFRVKM